MLTVNLPAELQASLLAAAQRSGLSLDSFMTHLCSNALRHERERERQHDQAQQLAAPADTRQRVHAWLSDLAAGQYSAYDEALPAGRPRRHPARPAATCVTPALTVASSTHSPPP